LKATTISQVFGDDRFVRCFRSSHYTWWRNRGRRRVFGNSELCSFVTGGRCSSYVLLTVMFM